MRPKNGIYGGHSDTVDPGISRSRSGHYWPRWTFNRATDNVSSPSPDNVSLSIGGYRPTIMAFIRRLSYTWNLYSWPEAREEKPGPINQAKVVITRAQRQAQPGTPRQRAHPPANTVSKSLLNFISLACMRRCTATIARRHASQRRGPISHFALRDEHARSTNIHTNDHDRKSNLWSGGEIARNRGEYHGGSNAS